MEVGRRFPARGRPISGEQTRGSWLGEVDGGVWWLWRWRTRGWGTGGPFLSPVTRASRQQRHMAGCRRERESCGRERGGEVGVGGLLDPTQAAPFCSLFPFFVSTKIIQLISGPVFVNG